MRMPRFAKLQNALIRKHSGKKQPDEKKRGALAFFNSPLGLWILSAIFLTVGGSYITKRQECLATARTNIELYRSLEREIYGRRLRILDDAASSSNSIDFYKALESNSFAELKQFDGQTLSALTGQFDQMRSKIVGVDILIYIENAALTDLYDVEYLLFRDPHYVQVFGGRKNGDVSPDFPGDEIYKFVRKNGSFLLQAFTKIATRSRAYDPVPACSAGNFLHDLWSDNELPSLKLVPSSWWDVITEEEPAPESAPSTSTAHQK